MIATQYDLLVLALVWVIYFLLHSLLASLRLKRLVAEKFSHASHYYRLVFNFLSIILIIPPAWLMHSFSGEVLWQWTGVGMYLSNIIAVLAVFGFLWSMRYYDGMDFIGVRQLKSVRPQVEDEEQFCLSPLHHYVRHPWYFFAIVIIWSRDMDTVFLVTAVLITQYFIVGSWFEEKKLVGFHGDIYRCYQRYVPGLFPLPWRYLDDKKRSEVLSSDNNDCE